MNRNHKSRLNRSVARLDKALDLAHQVVGDLYPAELRGIQTEVMTAIGHLQAAARLSADGLSGPAVTEDAAAASVQRVPLEIEKKQAIEPSPGGVLLSDLEEPVPTARNLRSRPGA